MTSAPATRDTSTPPDDNLLVDATVVGDLLVVDFSPRGAAVITLPADPGMPGDGVVSVNADGELVLTCGTGAKYIGPLVDMDTIARLRAAGDIRVNECYPGQTAIFNTYGASFAETP